MAAPSFSPLTPESWLALELDRLRATAQAMIDEGSWDLLPTLLDALEEMGLRNHPYIGHYKVCTESLATKPKDCHMIRALARGFPPRDDWAFPSMTSDFLKELDKWR